MRDALSELGCARMLNSPDRVDSFRLSDAPSDGQLAQRHDLPDILVDCLAIDTGVVALKYVWMHDYRLLEATGKVLGVLDYCPQGRLSFRRDTTSARVRLQNWHLNTPIEFGTLRQYISASNDAAGEATLRILLPTSPS